MPEVTVQLSDEQVELLRETPPFVGGDVIHALRRAVREQVPRPIKVGDKVLERGYEEAGAFEVLGVHDGNCWLWSGSGVVGGHFGRYITRLGSVLVRVEEGE